MSRETFEIFHGDVSGKTKLSDFEKHNKKGEILPIGSFSELRDYMKQHYEAILVKDKSTNSVLLFKHPTNFSDIGVSGMGYHTVVRKKNITEEVKKDNDEKPISLTYQQKLTAAFEAGRDAFHTGKSNIPGDHSEITKMADEHDAFVEKEYVNNQKRYGYGTRQALYHNDDLRGQTTQIFKSFSNGYNIAKFKAAKDEQEKQKAAELASREKENEQNFKLKSKELDHSLKHKARESDQALKFKEKANKMELDHKSKLASILRKAKSTKNEEFEHDNLLDEGLNIWQYNKVTGYWKVVRDLKSDGSTASKWLEIFEKDEPNEYFTVAKKQPRFDPTLDESTNLPPHLAKLVPRLEKLWKEKYGTTKVHIKRSPKSNSNFTMTDVTPKGYGPTNEEVAANNIGSGHIAAAPPDSPPMLKRKMFAGHPVFELDNERFTKARMGKRLRQHWKTYIGNDDDETRAIRDYANRNPQKPIVAQNKMSGAMTYLRYGNPFGN